MISDNLIKLIYKVFNFLNCCKSSNSNSQRLLLLLNWNTNCS